MRFRVEREVLADAVAWTARSLPSRPPVPVLAGVLLEVDGQRLSVSGFDYEVSTRVGIDVVAESAGRALVSGRLLAEITRSLPAHPVDLEVNGARVELTCGSARFTLPVMPVEDYPSLPPMPPTAGALESDVFASAVGQVVVAAGRDDTLPVLTGVRFEIDGERVTMAATDRYRLAVRELTWRPEQPGLTATALVPARTLWETAKSMASGAEVTLALAIGGTGEGMIGFAGSERRATTRLLDGEFPKYRSLLPSEHAALAHVPTAALTEAVKRVALVAERNTPVRLRFGAGELVLEAGGADEAQASECLEIGFEGDDLMIAFNPGFLLDGLNAIDSDTARMSFTSASKPAVLTGKEGGPDYRYLLMPVRLSG
ncbi:MAG: DNA polymerase III subunit beta [Pseudonocardiales bacterium]